MLNLRRVYRYGDDKRTCWVQPAVAGRPDAHRIAQRLLDGAGRLVRTMKDDRRSLVQLWALDGRFWVVKHYRGSAWKTFWYHAVGRTPAWREWRYARQLRRCGVRVIELVALVHERRWGKWRQALVSPYVDAPNLHQWLCRPDLEPAQRRRIAQAVGRQVGQIAAAGLANRDHKVSNLLIDAACHRDRGEPLIIDPARVKRRVSDQPVYAMLALLAQTAQRARALTIAEKLACLRAALTADRSVASASQHRLRHVAGQVSEMIAEHERSHPRRPDPD